MKRECTSSGIQIDFIGKVPDLVKHISPHITIPHKNIPITQTMEKQPDANIATGLDIQTLTASKKG